MSSPKHKPPVLVKYYQINAFADDRFSGNPAAVIMLEEFLDDSEMQSIAAEINLSETAFLVRAGERYALRWFTPTVEVPLCGHATLASGAAVLKRLQPERTSVEFETASGLIQVSEIHGRFSMRLPARASQTAAQATLDLVNDAVGFRPREVWEDEFNYLAVSDDCRNIQSAVPNFDAIRNLGKSGLIITAPGQGSFDFVSRYFAPKKGINEDPVTGAAHCMLTPYWAKKTGRTTFHAYQASPRGGAMICSLQGNSVDLVGDAIFAIEGDIAI